MYLDVFQKWDRGAAREDEDNDEANHLDSLQLKDIGFVSASFETAPKLDKASVM